MPKSRKNNRITEKNTQEDLRNEFESAILIEDSTNQVQATNHTPSPELTSLLETTPKKKTNSQYSIRITEEEEDHNSHLEPEVFCKRLLENLEIIKSIGVENNEIIIPKLSNCPEQVKKHQFGRSKSENHILQIQGVNLNPYLKYDDLIIKGTKDKENSINELSFFTPELLRAKHASTPINYNNNKKNRSRIPINEITNNSRNVRQKFDRIQSGKISKLSRTAPAIILSTPRKIERFKCWNEPIVTTSGIFKQLVQKCRSTTGNWASSLISLCTNLGIKLKSSLCEKTDNNSDIAQYRQEIERLNAKIEDLSANLSDIKTMLFQNIFEKNQNIQVNHFERVQNSP